MSESGDNLIKDGVSKIFLKLKNNAQNYITKGSSRYDSSVTFPKW